LPVSVAAEDVVAFNMVILFVYAVADPICFVLCWMLDVRCWMLDVGMLDVGQAKSLGRFFK
jgi:hypothetical protein